jgi:hypothetical protein
MLQPFGHEYRRLATFLRKELTPITAKNSTEDESDFITIDYSNISPVLQIILRYAIFFTNKQ